MFDEIHENIREGYPCPQCKNGSVEKSLLNDGKMIEKNKELWCCDSCDFIAVVNKIRSR